MPQAIDHNRHAVLMSKVDGRVMVQVRSDGFRDAGAVYQKCMELVARIASVGLIHCDFNEFNLMVNEETDVVTLIDFPQAGRGAQRRGGLPRKLPRAWVDGGASDSPPSQMVSVSHANAESLFDRDVECIIRFFTKKIGYLPEEDERLGGVIRPDFKQVAGTAGALDAQLEASGFKKEHQEALEAEMFAAGSGSDEEEDGDEEGSEADAGGSEQEDGGRRLGETAASGGAVGGALADAVRGLGVVRAAVPEFRCQCRRIDPRASRPSRLGVGAMRGRAARMPASPKRRRRRTITTRQRRPPRGRPCTRG